MSLVVNMKQRRTVAAGRQNQDPNKSVDSENELTPKKLSVDVERSIHGALTHGKNTTGRGRQMVLAELPKKQAAENAPPGMNIYPSGNKLLGGSAKSSEVGVENKLSISDIRKRRLDQESEARAPLSAWDTEEPEIDCADWSCVGSPAKSERTVVYTKRHKTTPLTPPLRSSCRRREPSPPPGFEPCIPEMRITEAEQDADDNSLNRQLMSPSLTEDDSDPYGFNSVRGDLEESNALEESLNALEESSNPLEESSTAIVLWSEPETPVHGVDYEPYSFLPQSPRKSHGLMNLGNTCYMNVIIQCLYNLSSFVTGMERFFGPLMKPDAFEDLGPLFTSDVESDESVHAALLKVFHDLKRAADRYDTVNPTVLKDAFAKQQSSFWGCIQQDAHEFFCSLIDQVQEEVSSELKKQYSTEADRPKLETVCPTTQNFSCLVRNNLTCAGCGNVTSVEGTDRYFCLGLPEDERTDETQNCSVESLLNLYFQETTMSRKCEKCGVEDTKSQNQILKLPHVLVLQLKRLHMDRDGPCTKVSAPVKFTPRLDIGPWCAQDKQNFWTPTLDDVLYSASHDSVASSCTTLSGGSVDWDSFTSSGRSLDYASFNIESPKVDSPSTNVSTCYRLYGVVNHLGFSDSAGHFFTDVLDADADRWLRCDDSQVSDVSEDSVFTNKRAAYMFFYVHEPVLRIKEKLD